jgi:hypothetical protein
MRIAQSILHLYPRAFRDRYEHELQALLEQNPPSCGDILDLLVGVCDAYLHPQLGTASMTCSERITRMFRTLRCSVLTIFCAYVGIILAGIAFQKLTEYDDFQEVARADPVVGLSFTLVLVAAVAALLAVLAGGLPVAVAVVRSALARKRARSLFLLILPILAFCALLGITWLLKTINTSETPPVAQIFFQRGLFFGMFALAAIGSPAALCLAVIQSEISERLLRFTLLAFALATCAMVVILASTLVWGLGLSTLHSHLFTSNNGLLSTSTAGTWLGIVIAMAAATGVAIVALRRGWSARCALCKAAPA